MHGQCSDFYACVLDRREGRKGGLLDEKQHCGRVIMELLWHYVQCILIQFFMPPFPIECFLVLNLFNIPDYFPTPQKEFILCLSYVPSLLAVLFASSRAPVTAHSPLTCHIPSLTDSDKSVHPLH